MLFPEPQKLLKKRSPRPKGKRIFYAQNLSRVPSWCLEGTGIPEYRPPSSCGSEPPGIILNSEIKESIMNALALSFHETHFDVVDRNGQPWLRLPQIAQALYRKEGGDQNGPPFENNIRQVQKLYQRHSDEFIDSMTALIELDTNGGKQQVRIFSLRGCHLLAMFARTQVAKEFRRWVLDVLDQLAQPVPERITPPLQGRILLTFSQGAPVAVRLLAEDEVLISRNEVMALKQQLLDDNLRCVASIQEFCKRVSATA
jgi:hypothetical protein